MDGYMDPLARLFGSNTRLKILRLFLFNDDQQFTAAEVEFRTKTPRVMVRRELSVLIAVGVVRKRAGKGKATYVANPRFVHYDALHSFLRTTTSIGDTDMLLALKRAGTLRLVVLSGIFSGAVDTKIDVLIVGDRLDVKTLEAGIHKLEAELGRELRYASFSTKDFRYRVGVYDRLIRDVIDFPHRVLLDKIGI